MLKHIDENLRLALGNSCQTEYLIPIWVQCEGDI